MGRAHARAATSIAAPLAHLLRYDVADWGGLGLHSRKERTVRSVLHGRLGDFDVHVKVFRPDTLADRARDALRRDRGEREAANLAVARSLGLPAVEALAWGAAIDRGQLRSFVLTRTIADAEPFQFRLPADVQRCVGALLRQAHERGLDPADLHPGNLLVDDAGRPWLLDLTSMRHAGAVPLRRRAAALALFCHDLDGGPLDPAAKDLLQGYEATGGPMPASFRRELELATRRWRAHALVAFGRRATRSCRHTEVPSRRRGQPRWHWHLPAAADAAPLRTACLEFLATAPIPLRRGRRGAVWLDGDLAVKERDRGAARSLWRAAYWLSFAGVATALPVALGLLPDRGLVFCRRLHGPTLAEELATGTADPLATASALGTSVGRLHAHGLRNRDLKFENLVRDPDTGWPCMVDLDGVRRCRGEDTRGLGADLGRLLAAFVAAGAPGGAAAQRRFVAAYLRAHRALRRPVPWRRIRRRAELRAREWASAHRPAAGQAN
ncbi:MAG: hypothetical protein KF830_02750 [Planctomycetes bacterium]|nr:hypothetical protein [Planctomycetota bacterium]